MKRPNPAAFPPRPRYDRSKFRIHPSPAYNGQLVVQKWYPESQIWGDVGDPVASYSEGIDKIRQLEQEST